MAQGELKEIDVINMGSKELAYLGDSVYDVYIRKALLLSGIRGVKELNRESEKYVTASSQADIYSKIQDELFEDEVKVFLRGRNTKLKHANKNVKISTYRLATGFECVFGYLYMLENFKRIEYLINLIVNLNEGKE